jgi:hypothetical protein
VGPDCRTGGPRLPGTHDIPGPDTGVAQVNMYIQTRRYPVEVTLPTPLQGRSPAQCGLSPSGSDHRISRHTSSQRSSSSSSLPPAAAASSKWQQPADDARHLRSFVASYHPSPKGTRQCEAQPCTHTVRLAHLAVGGIATRLEELKYLFRPGTGSRARGPRRSESLKSVGLPGRPKAGVAPTGPGSREVHLKTGVAQWWG